ncbi:MAG: methylenetetrahydrofolate reductase [NAD(P)H] [Betaproteobacteria bacterium]|nr:methylenetetrahydrofolate reductase [NAD(P)H] [Betaproteobacteria bacterium]MDH5220425.1 methylenetetrahydrofolate reductase [NAD(P)H] [Betaproteobacteria bacterium]MDH5351462.1 methylenetetrahydrofolate reductase [NAD(P)H] [Betaproteobacteria bacterium]
MGSVPVFSFEFFPPRTPEGKAKLRAAWQELARLEPRFFSCTYGAGGSTREGTLETVLEIRKAGHEAAPHISCVASTKKDVGEQLALYKSHGIRHVVALRGDLPSGIAASGEFRYANELVAFIRETTGDWFRIEVACYPEYHPQTRNAADEVKNFRKKVEAGADAAITQYFYNADAYFRFVDECRAAGIAVPIVPGIMPIGNFSQLARFSDACGAEIPRWMRVKLEGYRDDAASIRAFGLDAVTALCARLLAGGAPGLHFYTLNQAALSAEIWRRLKL